MIHMHFGCKDVVGRTTTYSDDSVRTLLIQAVTPDWRTSKPAFALEEGTIEQWIDYFEATDLCRPDPPGETCQMERNSLEMSESQGHRLHREGTGAELLQEGRSLLVRLRRDGTAIYLSPRVTSATVAKYLQPSPNISKHRQQDSDLAIPDRDRTTGMVTMVGEEWGDLRGGVLCIVVGKLCERQ